MNCISLESTGLASNTKITKLELGTFDTCTKLIATGLESNHTVAELDRYVFSRCTSLLTTGLEVDERVTDVPERAFEGDTALISTGLAGNDSVRTMGNWAFHGCTSLTSTGLESCGSIERISTWSFQDCTSLTSTGLAANTSIDYIGYGVFEGCTALGGVEDAPGRSGTGDLVLNQPAAGGQISLSSQVFKGTAFSRLYLMCDPDRFSLKDDPDIASLAGCPIQTVYVPASWAGVVDSLTQGDQTFSVDDGTLVIMDPMQSISATRKRMTSDAATLAFSANASFELVLSGADSGALGRYSVSVDAENTPQQMSVDIASGVGLGPSADTLMAAISPDSPVIYPSGARALDYNVVSVSKTCELLAVRYSIRFEPNGGDGSIPEQKMVYGESQDLSANGGRIARTNYLFDGWNTGAHGDGDGYADGGAVVSLTELEGDTVALFAQWESAVSLKLALSGHTLAADGGAGEPLAGCGFALASEPDADHEIYTVYTDEGKTAPVEEWPLMTGADGELDLYGISPGTYYVLNPAAPAGYQIMSGTHVIEVSEEGEVGIDGAEPARPDDGVIRLGVGFGSAPALPGTGGPVRPQVAAAGAAVLALWATCLALRARRGR